MTVQTENGTEEKSLLNSENILAEIDITQQMPDMSNVIYPPADIRKLADHTAKFTAKNDKALEDRIRESKKGNPKFCFLNIGDPYYNYYVAEKQRVRLGIESAPIPETQDEEAKKEQVKEQKQDIPNPPPPFQFHFEPPPIPVLDMDIIKLTALHIARNGPQFRSGLIQRERGNYQFDFLKPEHALFPYFSQLCEQYSLILNPNQQTLDQLKVSKDNKFKVLDRVMQRVRYSLYEEEENKKAAEREDKERIAFASIDWHDFVVVQTLEFTSYDKKSELPGPETAESIMNQALAAKKAAEMNKEIAEMGPLPTEEFNVDNVKVEDADAVNDSKQPSPPPQNPSLPLPPASLTNAPIKIRRDYVPKVGISKEGGESMQLCPICNQKIPSSQIDEHIKIEKLDPKWKAQKEIYESRNRDSNLLRDTTDVAKNLKNLSANRSDLFGNDEISLSRKIEEENERRKMNEKDKVKYDGFNQISNTPPNFIPPSGVPPPNSNFPPRPPANVKPPFMAICPPYIPPGTPNRPPMEGAFPPRPPFPAMGIPPQPFTPPTNRFVPPPFIPNSTNQHFTPPPIAPGAKKPKLEGILATLTPEHQFVEMNPSPVTVLIMVPKEENKPEWKLQGQILRFEQLPPQCTLGEIKEKIYAETQLPSNKQKITLNLPIKAPPQVAKNDYSLATYNLTGEVKMELTIKSRGGKK